MEDSEEETNVNKSEEEEEDRDMIRLKRGGREEKRGCSETRKIEMKGSVSHGRVQTDQA